MFYDVLSELLQMLFHANANVCYFLVLKAFPCLAFCIKCFLYYYRRVRRFSAYT